MSGVLLGGERVGWGGWMDPRQNLMNTDGRTTLSLSLSLYAAKRMHMPLSYARCMRSVPGDTRRTRQAMASRPSA
jgi:hypothetical protein